MEKVYQVNEYHLSEKEWTQGEKRVLEETDAKTLVDFNFLQETDEQPPQPFEIDVFPPRPDGEPMTYEQFPPSGAGVDDVSVPVAD